MVQNPYDKYIVDLGSGTGAVINYLQSNISKSNQLFAFYLSQSMFEIIQIYVFKKLLVIYVPWVLIMKYLTWQLHVSVYTTLLILKPY